MDGFKRIVPLLLFMSIFITVEAASRFYVPENHLISFNEKYGEQAVRRLKSLLLMMEKNIASTDDKKIIEVNKFFNQLEFRSDIITWKKKDYWASRLEFLGKGQGDCEDFAVAKFLTMIQVGVPEKKLFLTYVKAIGYPESAHLVVTYYQKPGAVPFVLDNYDKRILPATQRNDLIPVYSFTANSLYIQKQKGLGRRVNPASSKNLKNLKSIELEIYDRQK